MATTQPDGDAAGPASVTPDGPLLDGARIHDLAAFATARGWRHEPAGAAPTDGAVFGALLDARVTDRVTAPGEIAFEVGNVAGRVGGTRALAVAGMQVRTHYATPRQADYGYLSVHLPRPLPHLVLDAIANDGGGRSSLPIAISGDQRLGLEGDFDQHFALFAPRGYERDALYLFTPDVMALLIDETGDLDVEVVGDRLHVFSPAQFDLRDPQVWQRLEQLVAVRGAKALRRSRHYADERALEGSISVEGRSLDQGSLSRRGMFTTLGIVGGMLIVVPAFIIGVTIWVLVVALHQ